MWIMFFRQPGPAVRLTGPWPDPTAAGAAVVRGTRGAFVGGCTTDCPCVRPGGGADPHASTVLRTRETSAPSPAKGVGARTSARAGPPSVRAGPDTPAAPVPGATSGPLGRGTSLCGVLGPSEERRELVAVERAGDGDSGHRRVRPTPERRWRSRPATGETAPSDQDNTASMSSVVPGRAKAPRPPAASRRSAATAESGKRGWAAARAAPQAWAGAAGDVCRPTDALPQVKGSPAEDDNGDRCSLCRMPGGAFHFDRGTRRTGGTRTA